MPLHFLRRRRARLRIRLFPTAAVLAIVLSLGSYLTDDLLAQATASVRIQLHTDRPTYPPAELVNLDNPQQASTIHHLVTASIDPSRNRLTATDRVTVLHRSGVPSTLPFSFLLWKDLALTDISAIDSGSDSIGVVVTERERPHVRSFWERPPYDELEGYEHARQVDLELRGMPAWPETITVIVSYEGTVLDSLHPPRAAYARSFDTTAGLIVEQGAFLAGSTFWIPSRPEDVFTFDLRAEVPASWRSVSQGRMATATSHGDAQFTRWLCPHPMEEIYLVAGPWEEHHLRHGDVFAQTFTYADTDSSIYNRYLRGTGRYLDLYEEKIGPYPFAKFALVENFWQTGFGMPSFTLLGNRVIRLPFILDTSYGHEILHNWWGNGVFVRSEEGNWCEGLTTYGADYAYEEQKGPDAARSYRRNALQNYLDYVSESEDLPLSRFRERHDFSTQAVGYSKSMMVFHQVRRALGDAAFQAGLQQFYRAFLWRRASWSDLFDSFAAQLPGSASQRAIWARRHREQWIERAGAPTLRLEEAVREPVGPKWSVEIRITQEVGPGESPFWLQVPVRVIGSDGETLDQVVDMEGLDRELSVSCSFEPVRVEIDPEFDVLRRLHREETPPTLSQVLGADSVVIVIAEGQGEEMTAALRALAESWAKDQAAAVLMEPEWAGVSPSANGAIDPPPAVWFFGLGRMAQLERMRQGDLQSEVESSEGSDRFFNDGSFVQAGSFEGGSPWGMLMPENPEVVASLGRKIPHYGKYSFLTFQGDTIFSKEVWKPSASPLVRDLTS